MLATVTVAILALLTGRAQSFKLFSSRLLRLLDGGAVNHISVLLHKNRAKKFIQ